MDLRRRTVIVALVACASLATASLANAEETGAARGPKDATTPVLPGLTFRALGPTESGGRITAVGGTDADPLRYYAGAADGGVWKTSDDGIAWKPVLDVGAIGALEVAPSDPDVVWVGAGEANPRNDVIAGDGAYVTRDGGAHWTHAGLAGTSNIARIAIDPHDPQRVLIGALGDPFRDGAERGVFRTTDGGRTWRKTLYLGPSSGVSDLVADPREGRTVFAGMWQVRREPWRLTSGGPQGGLYRSRDGGETWTKLTNGLPSGLTGRIGIAIAANDPQRVYAVIESKAGLLWRSDDGGDSWRMTSRDTLIDNRPFYFSRIAVDPADRDRVVALSVRLSESRDGGATFAKIAPVAHWDHHALWWSHDGRRIVEGNDGGVMRSLDGGKTWARDYNLDVGQIYHVGYDLRTPYDVCAGLQDNDSWCAPSNANNGIGVLARDWLDVQGGDGMWTWPDPANPDLTWGSTTGSLTGQLAIYDARSRELVDVTPYPNEIWGADGIASAPYRFNWNSPLAFDPFDPHVAYYGGNVVFRTADRGRTWTTISPDLTRDDKAHQQISGGPIDADMSGAENSDTILEIAPSPLARGTIWVGTDDGRVGLTRDGGATWRNVTPPGTLPWGRYVTIEPSHAAAGTAYAVLDRHLLGDRTPYLFATTDFGASWRSLAAGLPKDESVRTVREDPHAPELLFAGTERGLEVSFDRGAAWQPLRANLPPSAVFDLRIQPVADDLIVATHGRSLWILDDLKPLEQYRAARAAGTYAFSPQPAYEYLQLPTVETGDDGHQPANVFVADDPKPALLSFYQPAVAASPPTIDIVDGAGRVVRHLRGTHLVDGEQKPYVTNDAGFNRVGWDLTEDPPVAWKTAPHWNSPESGPQVLPGTYVVRYRLGAAAIERPLVVRPDPRAAWTPAQLAERHAFLMGLGDDVSRLDVALNALDALRAATHDDDALRARAAAVSYGLSRDPRAEEDGLLHGDGPREQVLFLASLLSTSQQPPTQRHRMQAALVTSHVDAALARYRTFAATLPAGMLPASEAPSPAP